MCCYLRGTSPTVREGSDVQDRALPDGRASAPDTKPTAIKTQLLSVAVKSEAHAKRSLR